MRFGIISTADIATEWMIPAIRKSDHEVVAIGSRNQDSAVIVAEEFDVPHAYGSYEALFEDESVDAVYNPLPNGLHAEWTKKAADHGLDVLCEKPLTANAEAAGELFDYCEDAGVTLMEAWMYQFHPRTARLREIVANELESPRYATSTFTWRMADGAEDVRLDPDLAGGALMDVGCYCVSGIRGVFGEPDRVYAEASDTRDSGVDTQLLGTLAYEDGRTASFACGFDTDHEERLRIEAANGWLEAHDCYGPDDDQQVALSYAVDGREVTETFDAVDHYQLEVEAFADAVAAGDPAPISKGESVANMATIDALYESADRHEPVTLD